MKKLITNSEEEKLLSSKDYKDILKDCFYIAQKANLDVVEFKGSGHQNGRPVNVVYQYNNEYSNIIYQPELSFYML